MPTYGQRPDDVVQDSRGNALKGIRVELYLTQSAAAEGTDPEGSAVTDVRGRWSYTTDALDLYARIPDGTVWQVAQSVEEVVAAAQSAADDATAAASSAASAMNAAAATANGKVSKGDLVINVRDYGASGDGIADDTTAINAALTAASALGGRVVHFPSSSTAYRVTATIAVPDGVTVDGVGVSVTADITSFAVFTLGSKTQIRGLQITNTATSPGIGIAVRANAKGVKITGVTLLSPPGTGQGVQVSQAGISDVSISGCTFDGHRFAILTNGAGVGGADDLTGVSIIGNQFRNITGDAIEINHPGDVVGDTTRTAANGFVIANNVISVFGGGSGSGNGFAIGVAGPSDVSITGNTILAARVRGIHIEDQTYRVTVAGNTITGMTGTEAQAGISVAESVRSASITGNTVENVGASTTSFGIDLNYNTGAVHSSECIVSANVVRGIAGVGIRTGGQSTKSSGQLAVVNNVVTACTGDGIDLVGYPDTSRVTGNIVTDCGGWGIAPEVNGFSNALLMDGNLIDRCTLGDVRGYAITSGVSTGVDARQAAVKNFTADGTGYAEVPLFRLGRVAVGVIHLSAMAAVGASRTQVLAKIEWDGTTFKVGQVAKDDNVNFVSSALKVVDGKLVWRVYCVTAGTVVARTSGRFRGLMLEDGVARTGTIASTAMAAV